METWKIQAILAALEPDRAVRLSDCIRGLLDLLNQALDLLKAAVIAENNSVNQLQLNDIHTARMNAVASRKNGIAPFLPIPTQTLFDAVPTSRMMKLFWIAMAGFIAGIAATVYRRFYTKR